MRFGLYSPPAQTEVFPSLQKIATQPRKSSDSVFAAFNDSLHKLEQLQTHDMKEQRMRNMELVSNISRQAKKQAMFSMQALKEQLAEELDTMKSEYEDYVEILRRKAEEEERERERLRKLEEERQRIMEEKKRKAAEEEKRRLAEEARKKAEEEERTRIAEAKKAEERAKAAAEEKKHAEEELKRQKEEEAKKNMKGMTVQTQIQKSILEQHDIIKNIKDNIVSRLDQDKPLKKEMNIIKRKINVKLGQLSTSRRQAQSIFEDIASLVKSVPANSLSYNWLLNFIAKALVSQAETEVTVKSSAAVPLAYIAASLLVNFADFHYYFVARLVKKCCFVIGYTGTIDTENGRLRMGWKRGGDDKWESEVKYEERVAGILSVWASIPQFIDSSGLPLFTWASHWSFLARMLNTSQELVSDVHYFIVSNWWEAAAKSFTDRYGKQAGKLLMLATHDWAAYGVSKKFGAASRLQVLGEDLQTGNRFNTLKQMEN